MSNAAPTNDDWVRLLAQATDLYADPTLGRPHAVPTSLVSRLLRELGMARTVSPKRITQAARDPWSPVAIIRTVDDVVVGQLGPDNTFEDLPVPLWLSAGGFFYVPSPHLDAAALRGNGDYLIGRDVLVAAIDNAQNEGGLVP